MRNWYDRKYIIINEPVHCRRGHTFERKLVAAESKGYELVGNPTFYPHYEGTSDIERKFVLYGVAFLRRRKDGV